MKTERWILSILIFLLSFYGCLFTTGAAANINTNYTFVYDLDKQHRYFQVDAANANDEETMKKLYELIKEEKLTLLLERKDHLLGVYDTLGKHNEDSLFFGSYFTKTDFQDKKNVALRIFQNAENASATESIDDTEFEIIGEFLEDYPLYANRNTCVYSLFASPHVTGTYYIETDNTLLYHQIQQLFSSQGYAIHLQTSSISIAKSIAYLANDKHTQIMLFLLALAFAAAIFTNYSLLLRKQSFYHAHFLVGSNKKSIYLQEAFQIGTCYLFACILSILCCHMLLHHFQYDSFITIWTYAMSFSIGLVFTLIHMLLFHILQKQTSRRTL